MNNKLVTFAIFATVAIIVTGAVLVPVIEDSTDGDLLTYHNDSGNYVSKATATAELAVSKAANSSDIIVGGDTFAPGARNFTIVAMPGCVIASGTLSQDYVILINDTLHNYYHQVGLAEAFDLSISEGVCTYSAGSTSYSLTVASDYYYQDTDGDYAVCSPGSGVYAPTGKIAAYSQVSRHTYWHSEEGDYDNTDVFTSMPVVVTSELVPGSEDKVEYITGISVNGTTSYVCFAPRLVEIHINEMDNGPTSILYAVPVLVLVTIAIGAVAVVRTKD